MINAGIVFNGGIIIDNQFRTNDDSIFAAGPGTKYSSRYHDSNSDHANFSSLEIGMQVHVARLVSKPGVQSCALGAPSNAQRHTRIYCTGLLNGKDGRFRDSVNFF